MSLEKRVDLTVNIANKMWMLGAMMPSLVGVRMGLVDVVARSVFHDRMGLLQCLSEPDSAVKG